MVAGLAGPTAQATAEAQTARGIGYHAGLLSLAAMKSASEDEIIAHCEAVAREIPLVGFYLQPAVGGVILGANFWRRFASIDNVIAIKIAPFNRYRTLDVLRGVAAANALDRVALYTGNDDHILLDLMPRSRNRGGTRILRPGDDTTLPAMSISPDVGCSSPATQRSVVVLPQPEGPSSTTISPAGTAKLTPSIAGRPIANCLRRSVTSRVAVIGSVVSL